jgi:membrane protein insertase Oxa1/YidC/SpoIIIJ
MDAKKKILLERADKALKARMDKIWAKYGTKSKSGTYTLKTIDAEKAYTEDRIRAQKEYNAALKKAGFKPLGGRFARK